MYIHKNTYKIYSVNTHNVLFHFVLISIHGKKAGELIMITQEEVELYYFDTPSAARQLKVTDARVRKLCLDGRLEGALKTGRAWLIPKTSVENFTRKKRGKKKSTIVDRLLLNKAITESKKCWHKSSSK